jgi:AbrB family looped-hinge helix DNA binding protein
MTILDITEITTRFQTTIPKRVREKLGITTKDRILWIEENGKIIVKKA